MADDDQNTKEPAKAARKKRAPKSGAGTKTSRKATSGARNSDPRGGEQSNDDDAVNAEVVDAPDVDILAEDVDVSTLADIAVVATAKDTGIAKWDPFRAYMRDVQRYPLLKPDEEHALAVKLIETGDVDAARKLVTSNLRLVVKIAYDYRRAYRNLLDLVQEGNIGLMQAVRKYDPYRGVKLSSYAAWWIRAYMLRFILNNWRLVKIGTTQAQRKLFFNLNKEKAKLAALGIDATSELIADRLQVSKEDVEQMDRRLSAGEASLDAPIGNSEGRSVSRMELLPAGGAGIDELLAEEEIAGQVGAKIREFGITLTGKDAKIFNERLVAEDPRTLQELGDEFGVTRERVRQLEKRLQDKLKKYLEDSLGRVILDV